ncbi:hypothetical protein [Cryptosporangium minutisporangium]|uniref:HAF repeat-containing protein n=1 Tax=Cryptosporangium minutisporangium TaxID=113569 RepID=A0ABP6TBV9_9ACTN
MSFARRPALIVAVGVTAIALAVLPGSVEAAPVVSAAKLPVPAGTTSSYVADLNNSGVSVGTVTVNGTQRAIRWSGRGYTLLDTPAANPGSTAAVVNEGGTVAGTLAIPGLSNVVIRRWLPAGSTSDCAQSGNTLGVTAINLSGETLNRTVSGPGVYSANVCRADGTSVATGMPSAFALADDGRVAGYINTGSIQGNTLAFVPVVRSSDATVTQLPVPDGKSGEAYAFGPGNTVIGEIGSWTLHLNGPRPYVTFDPEKVAIWRNGQLTQLGTLGGATSSALPTQRTVSRTGDIIGTSLTASGQNHAFLWRQGRMIDLGTLGGPSSRPTAVNDRGQVVGVSTTKSGASHAFLWSGGRMIDLGAPGGATSTAVDINDTGQIVGYVQATDGTHSHAVRWTVRGS